MTALARCIATTIRICRLGKFSLLKQIEFAQDLGLRWIYLGYAVKQCPSLAYKFSYEPYEILNSYTELDAPAVWEGRVER